ncbi:MAG: hypothetical protein HY584_00760 [Candidatus Omnitrophica bacterium]|nr:hypothetical protein [Candidatus Omnitrophota bacterium]
MKQLIISMLVAALAFSQGVAYAKSVGGKVVSVDSAASTITVGQVNPETGAEENVTVGVKDTTTYSGVDSLASLAVGDEIWVDTEEDATTKSLTATSVQRLEVPAPAEETTAAEAPPTGM